MNSADAPEAYIYGVSDFLDQLNELISTPRSFIHGEVLEYKVHPTGSYFTIADPRDGSVLPCYAPPSVVRGFLMEAPSPGVQVKIGGHANVYKPKGRLSFVVEHLEIYGEGSLKKAYEAMKKKLEIQGLFSRKRAIPECIQTVALITSARGAVVDDFRRNLRKIGLQVSLYDIHVEGIRAQREIIDALARVSARHETISDVVVLVRGGGSLEDLQAFNSEAVARALFACAVPTICAIGHDRDVPIAQLVADMGVSTASIAAIQINKSWDAVEKQLRDISGRLPSAFESSLENLRSDIRHCSASCLGYWRRYETYVETTSVRISQSFMLVCHNLKNTLASIEKILAAADPRQLLKRGYSIVTNEAGQIVKDASQLRPGTRLRTRLAKGGFASTVDSVQ